MSIESRINKLKKEVKEVKGKHKEDWTKDEVKSSKLRTIKNKIHKLYIDLTRRRQK
jgi:hypothetical protein